MLFLFSKRRQHSLQAAGAAAMSNPLPALRSEPKVGLRGRVRKLFRRKKRTPEGLLLQASGSGQDPDVPQPGAGGANDPICVDDSSDNEPSRSGSAVPCSQPGSTRKPAAGANYVPDSSDEGQPAGGRLRVDAALPDPRSIRALDEVGKFFAHSRCPRCRAALFIPNTDGVARCFSLVLGHGKNHAAGYLNSILPCCLCRSRTTCIGCGRSIIAAPNPSGPRHACESGRLFVLWLLLCGPDFRDWARALPPTPKRFQSRPASANRSVAVAASSGGGTGYGEKCGWVAKKERLPDGLALFTRVFIAIEKLWPSPAGDSRFDREPPAILLSMVLSSPLVAKASALLRNDSIEFITAHSRLYDALFSFVVAVGRCPATATAVFRDRLDLPSLATLPYLSLDPPLYVMPAAEGGGGAQGATATSESLVGLMRPLVALAGRMLSLASSHTTDFENTHGKRLLAQSRRLIRVGDDLDAGPADHQQSVAAQDGLANEARVRTFRAWHREHVVTDIPDADILEHFAFAPQVATLGSRYPPGRMKKLISEITGLQTSLPEGVYLRHGESRLDIMKVLITGPTGTPYENGLFEFDLLIPLDYPSSPPQMRFRTTAGDTVAFNPNLYSCGIVCLSLLGTWAGQRWVRDQSTLLQLFVSIQSMIFCAEPWYNEPGRVAGMEAAQSETYNSSLRGLTVQHAMLQWLVGVGSGLPGHMIWADVVNEHFQHSAKDIVTTTASWADGLSDDSVMYIKANEIRRALQSLYGPDICDRAGQ